jgi:hypothetical protein
MDVRASNAGDAFNDQLYTPTPPMLSQKQDFIEVQLWHQGIGERGENIKMINEGIKGEVDEFGFAQRITQPFIAQALADKKQVMDTEKEIETDLITKGKLEFLRRQGLLLEPERQGTFLPSARQGLRQRLQLSPDVLMEDARILSRPSDRPIEAGESSMLTQEEQRKRDFDERIRRSREARRQSEEVIREADRFLGRREEELTVSASASPAIETQEDIFFSAPSSIGTSLRSAMRERQVGRREQPSFPPSQERLDEARRILQRHSERQVRTDPSDFVPGTTPFSLFE